MITVEWGTSASKVSVEKFKLVNDGNFHIQKTARVKGLRRRLHCGYGWLGGGGVGWVAVSDTYASRN
jgi:hypothetical protein